MADGLCIEDTDGNVIEKTIVKDYDNVMECMNKERVNDVNCENVKSFYISSASDKLFDKLCSVKGSNVEKHEGFLDITEMPCSPNEEDCRKKRCADRYDSSESSDSGVAVLSCTDCSGSSTASSDIADPGSPFSTTSSHSEDSASQPAKMPPTQSAHHPPWPWAMGENLPVKRMGSDKTGFSKKMKVDDEDAFKQQENIPTEDIKTPPVSMGSTLNHQNTSQISNQPSNSVNKSVTSEVLTISISSDCNLINKAPSSNLLQNEKLVKVKKTTNNNKKPETTIANKTQGKITEYFKSQMKANGIKKALSNATLKSSAVKSTDLHKYFSLVGGLKQNVSKSQSNLRKIDVRTVNPTVKKVTTSDSKSRKLSPVTIPRKILPAPSKVCDKITVNSINNVNVNNFPPTVTLTTLAIPPNLAYLHTKTPKPPDNNSYIVQQFTTLSSDKINAIPVVNAPCINTVIHHPLQKITTINNYNCFKLNATVVPIVKLNTLPSKLNGSTFNNVALNVDHNVSATLVSAKPKISECSVKQTPVVNISGLITKHQKSPASLEAESVTIQKHRIEEQSPPSSDSGVSVKDQLEISVNLNQTEEPQKSPILSQPKTIRFPAKSHTATPFKEPTSSHTNDSTACRWAECHAQFDTSGALLEHLQIKHVISQATQEHYVCLWLGCKVHGRKSCSRTWLERHVLAHAGTKPFRCIVEGCGMRYNSQVSLERHVNGHFSTDGSQSASAKKSVENGSVKLFKRNGKRIRFRRQPWSARMFDFFDNGIMEGLQYRLLKVDETQTQSQKATVPGDSVLLHSQVLARRMESDGSKKVLLRWSPSDIIPDEWVRESEYSKSKTVSIRSLQPDSIDSLQSILFPQQNSQYVRHKQRRKPSKSNT